MSDWTEGRTWTRVVRGETRAEDGLLTIRREVGRAACYWEVTMVAMPEPVTGSAWGLAAAKRAALAAHAETAARLRAARGGA